MRLFPDQFWPTGLMPQSLFPDDARRYAVLRRVVGGDDVVVATAEPGDLQHIITGLDDSADEFYIRAYNRANQADEDLARLSLRRIAFAASGALILPIPGAVRDLRLVAGPGGLVTAQWSQRSRGADPRAASFNVYLATGTGTIDFTTPTLPGVVAGGRPRSTSLGIFAHGTAVKASVRAVSAQGAEDDNTRVAVVTADAQPPAVVTIVSAEVAS
ncbi:MAG: hypothetical protein AAGL98_03640 [Planctomycetota bacterium]